MNEIKLTDKELRLVLGILDTTKYEDYWREWEFASDKESLRLERKFSKKIKE